MANPTQTFKFQNEEVDVATDPKTGLATNNIINRRYINPPTTTTSTPAATPTTTPAPAKANPDVAALTNDPIASYYQKLKDFNPETDEQAIKDRIRKEQQAALDAIDQKYTSIYAEEARGGEDRLGQNRAILARSGLVGSDIGSSQTEGVRTYNRQRTDAIAAEKALEVASVFGKINSLASEEIKARKQEALGKIEGIAKLQEKARGLIPTIAKSGAQLTPEQRQKLAQQTGYDELTFDSLLNYYKDLPERGETEFKTIKQADGGEMLLGITKYPNGKVETKEYPVSTGGKPVKTYDGVPYIESRDEMGNVSLTPVSGFLGKDDRSAAKKEYDDYVKDEKSRGNNKVLSFDAWQTKDANRKRSVSNTTINYGQIKDEKLAKAIGAAAPAMDALRDPNSKYMDARAYKDMYAAFVKENPGNGDEFMKQFPLDIYINPADRRYFDKP